MNMKQKSTNLVDLKVSLEKEFKDKSVKHEEFLNDIISFYCVNMTKNHAVGAKKLKMIAFNKSNDILKYTNHLYHLNQENIKLIECLYQKLNNSDQ